MALTQTSLSGGRTTGGNHVAYTLVGTGAAQSDAPALGDNITTYAGGAGQPATPPTTDMTALLCVESHSDPHPTFKAKWAVRAVFDALRTVTISGLALPSGWYAIEVSPGIVGDVRRGVGKTVLLDVPSAADNKTVEASFPYKGAYPSESGLFAPIMQRYRIRGASRPTRNEVTLYYDPPTVEDILILDTSLVRVEARSVQQVTRPMVDLNENYVWHEERDPSGGPSYKWEPVAGTGIRFDRRAQFRTRFARDYQMGSNLLYYQDTVNGATMQQYWMCPTGTLLFAGWTKYRAPTTEKLWIYDAIMEYLPGGWNGETGVQKYEYRAYMIELLDANGDSLDPKKYEKIGDWFPTEAVYGAEFYPSRQWPLVYGNFDW